MSPRRAAVSATLALAGAVVAAVLTGCTAAPADAPRDASGTPTASNAKASAFSIKVGDCLDDADLSSVTATAPIVPCAQPHDSEAYQSFTLKDGDYPGQDAVLAEADTDCGGTAFADFIGIASADSVIQYSYYYPTSDTWAEGDRQIMCTAYQVDENGKPAQTTGTLKDIAK